MAIAHYYEGPVFVEIQKSGGAFDPIGFTRDGVPVRIEPRYFDIATDDRGGERGVPSDTQFLGAIANLNLDLTKYEKDQLDQLKTFTDDATIAVGTVPEFGRLIVQEGIAMAIRLNGGKEKKTFHTCFIRQAIEYNSGTRARFYRLGFECWLRRPGTGDNADKLELFEWDEDSSS